MAMRIMRRIRAGVAGIEAPIAGEVPIASGVSSFVSLVRRAWSAVAKAPSFQERRHQGLGHGLVTD